MSRNLPKGPRDRERDLASDWFKGNTTVWLTKFGKPIDRVDTSLFREISGVMDTVAGAFRKLYCTDLVNSKKQVDQLFVLAS